MTENELAKIITKVENTSELGEYWAKRYEKFLKDRVFVLDPSISQILNSTEIVMSPVTPFGHIDLTKFVSRNKAVDEVSLQNTIETAVRFLDSIIDTINFSIPAKEKVLEYRKIGLGIANFKEYLEIRSSPSEIDEIDYLGNLISSSAYRASEALSEEKGTCVKWKKMSRNVKPKAFEYWYNHTTGEVKNGLDISEEYDQDTIQLGFFDIIARRNLNILLYPNDIEWQIWSDRDDMSRLDLNHNSSSSTQKNTSENKINPINNLLDQGKKKISNWLGLGTDNEQKPTLDEITKQIYVDDNSNQQNMSKSMPTLEMIQQDIDKKSKIVEPLKVIVQNQDAIKIDKEADDENNFILINPSSSLSQNQDIENSFLTPLQKVSILSKINPIEQVEIIKQTSNTESKNNTSVEIESITDDIAGIATMSKSSLMDIGIENTTIKKIAEPVFHKNNIVKIVNKTLDDSNEIFVVSEVSFDNINSKYDVKLTGKNDKFIETDLQSVDANLLVTEIKNQPKIELQAVILSNDGQKVLVDKETNTLPTTKLLKNPESDLSNSLSSKFNIISDLVEISDVSFDNHLFSIVYYIKGLSLENCKNVEWLDISQVNNLHIKNSLDKIIDRIRRWQSSSKLKAEKIAEEITNTQKIDLETKYSSILESKIAEIKFESQSEKSKLSGEYETKLKIISNELSQRLTQSEATTAKILEQSTMYKAQISDLEKTILELEKPQLLKEVKEEIVTPIVPETQTINNRPFVNSLGDSSKSSMLEINVDNYKASTTPDIKKQFASNLIPATRFAVTENKVEPQETITKTIPQQTSVSSSTLDMLLKMKRASIK